MSDDFVRAKGQAYVRMPAIPVNGIMMLAGPEDATVKLALELTKNEGHTITI